MYNKKSEKLAILNCFILTAQWSAEDVDSFRERCTEETGYHGLVAFCRGILRMDKEGDIKINASGNKPVVIKAKAWLKTINATKDREALLEIKTALETRLAMLKPKAKVTNLSDARKERGDVVLASESAMGAVNPETRTGTNG
jgi:hypothetical protein